MILTTLKEPHEVVSVSAEVDVDATGGRYHVLLTYDPVRHRYTLSAPNHYVSIETSMPDNCADKLMEHSVARPDASAIEEVVKQLLLPKLREKLAV